jgi:hypothetical protein
LGSMRGYSLSASVCRGTSISMGVRAITP